VERREAGVPLAKGNFRLSGSFFQIKASCKQKQTIVASEPSPVKEGCLVTIKLTEVIDWKADS